MSVALGAGPDYDLAVGHSRITNLVYDYYLRQSDVESEKRR